MTFNTGNNVPSTDPRDLYDNAENLDKLVNGADPFYADRKGVLRESWAGMENTFDTSQEGRENAFTLSQADKESRFQAFLVSSGYVGKGDYAANVVLAERNEYVFVSAATTGTTAGLYFPTGTAAVPLTLTGDWATDLPNLSLREEDVLRQELSNITQGSDLVARAGVVRGSISELAEVPTNKRQAVLVQSYHADLGIGGGTFYWDASRAKAEHDGGRVISPTVPWGALADFLNGVGETDAAGSGCWVLQAERVSLTQYGARAATGIDDAASIRAAMASGEPLEFGDLTYEYSSVIDLALTSRIDWSASGATLRYMGVDVQSCLKLTVPAFKHQISGRIVSDAQEASHTGWFFESTASGAINVSPDLVAVQLTAINVRRHTLGLSYGDGILIVGGFHRVYLERPHVFNARLTAGANDPGVFGIFGISVTRSADGESRYVDIVEPHVENIFSDDPANYSDQDGIRLFSSISAATEATHNVWGGTVKNVRNRSVKHQGQSGIISGLRIIKEAAVVNGGVAGVGPNDWDIEAQQSGVTIRDIHFTYTGFGSRGVARWVGNTEAGRTVANGTISGIRGEITGTSIFGIVFVTDQAASLGCSVSDVNVVGPSDYLVGHQATGTGVPTLSLTNISGQPTIAGVWEVGNGIGYVLAANVANTGGASVPLMSAVSGSQDRRLQAVNSPGWTDSPSVTSKTGVVADAGLLQIAPSGVGSSGGIVLISAGFDRAATCLACFDDTGVTILQQTAARFVAGDTTEPASGDFRLYFSGGKLNIRNRFGATRNITANLVG
ncbi:hypothetical protein [Stutzerimonas stutzeri]|uniref:Tail spike TSP1/Gp66 N-terminal domain-containing protein n=1 Tax=Stutzerimonas stutzeri TaxID=316 RepID=A0A172WRY4_STUST|nr:hypothetical protein [Stutzerimonas stutzeri]ANF26045.1 hypothetical protein PS273GM_13265 [Stutzerimonas stutzeri]